VAEEVEEEVLDEEVVVAPTVEVLLSLEVFETLCSFSS